MSGPSAASWKDASGLGEHSLRKVSGRADGEGRHGTGGDLLCSGTVGRSLAQLVRHRCESGHGPAVECDDNRSAFVALSKPSGHRLLPDLARFVPRSDLVALS